MTLDSIEISFLFFIPLCLKWAFAYVQVHGLDWHRKSSSHQALLVLGS